MSQQLATFQLRKSVQSANSNKSISSRKETTSQKRKQAHIFRQTWQGWQGMAEDAAAASAAAGYDAAALAEAAASMVSPGTSGETEQTAAAAVDDAAEVAGADRRAGSVEAGDLVAEEQKKAEEGGSMGVSLPGGWVSLPLNDRLMHHPAVPVSLQ